MADIKISELEPTTDLEGLYTIGSDKNNLSKKVSLQFLKDAANYANMQGDYAKEVGDSYGGKLTELESETNNSLSKTSVAAETFIRQVKGGVITIEADKWISDVENGYIELNFKKPKDIATSSFPLVWKTASGWSGFIVASNNVRYYDNGVYISGFIIDLSAYKDNSVISIRIEKNGTTHYCKLNGVQKSIAYYEDAPKTSEIFVGGYPAEPITAECITDYYSLIFKGDNDIIIYNASSNFKRFSAQKYLMGNLVFDADKELSVRSITYGKANAQTSGILTNSGDIVSHTSITTSDYIDLKNVDTGVGAFVFSGLFPVNSGNYAGLVVYDDNYQVTAYYTDKGIHIMKPNDRYIRFTPIDNSAKVTAAFCITKDTLKGNYTLSDIAVMPSSMNLRGEDCIIEVGTKGQLILTDGCTIDGVTFKGNWQSNRMAGEGEYRYDLIPLVKESDVASVDSYMGDEVVLLVGQNATIQDAIFKDIDRLCIKYTDNKQAYKVKTQCNIIGNHFDNVRAAIHYIGEFGRIIGNVFHSCVYGAILDAGNLAMSSCNFVRCDIGMLIRSSHGNAGHSEFSSVEAAHCGLAGLYIESLPRNLGNVFSACHFADAPIIGVDCSCLMVTASRIDTFVDIRKGGYCGFTSCIVGSGYYNRDNKGYIFNLPIGSILRNNLPMDNTIIDAEINN